MSSAGTTTIWRMIKLEILLEQVRRISAKGTASAKAYMVMMARTAAALEFRPSQQEEIKCMIQLLGPYDLLYISSVDKRSISSLKYFEAYAPVDSNVHYFLYNGLTVSLWIPQYDGCSFC